jgi:hypothetical protein
MGGGSAALGEPQGWTTGLPRAGFATDTAGEHQHLAAQNGPGQWGNHPDSFTILARVRMTYGPFANYTSPAGAHSHVVLGGDAEARPDNATVSFFIRID